MWMGEKATASFYLTASCCADLTSPGNLLACSLGLRSGQSRSLGFVLPLQSAPRAAVSAVAFASSRSRCQPHPVLGLQLAHTRTWLSNDAGVRFNQLNPDDYLYHSLLQRCLPPLSSLLLSSSLIAIHNASW